VAAIVLLLVLASCASEPSLSPGTYTATITREDSSSYFTIGEWELTLAEGNGYSLITKDGKFREEGDYTLTQDQMVFAMTEGKYPCGGKGTYQWASDGKALTLTAVEDGCEGRSTLLTMHPWSQQD
jgi:hypothetical protein